jgi:hypothetical protein
LNSTKEIRTQDPGERAGDEPPGYDAFVVIQIHELLLVNIQFADLALNRSRRRRDRACRLPPKREGGQYEGTLRQKARVMDMPAAVQQMSNMKQGLASDLNMFMMVETSSGLDGGRWLLQRCGRIGNGAVWRGGVRQGRRGRMA